MLNSLAQLEHPTPTEKLLLYGDPTKTIAHNAEVFQSVHLFIKSTKRFTN
jgi:hypothetical protein